MSTTFPEAPPGTFRLFRFLALYPVPKILLQTFPYPNSVVESGSASTLNPYHSHVSGYSDGTKSHACPPYDAVSYVWSPHLDVKPQRDPYASQSSAVFDEPLTVVTSDHGYERNITVYVTNHLIYGLLTAQELCAPTWLFADAICIDQYDVRDKAVQVQGMDRVFRGAGRVLVWLGADPRPATVLAGAPNFDPNRGVHNNSHADTSMGACLSRVPTLVKVLEAYLDGRDHDERNSNAKKKHQFTRHIAAAAAGLPSEHDSVWQALERLRLNPWFDRLWVVQEVILSSDSILLYGSHALPWLVYVRLTVLCERIITSLFSKQHDAKIVNLLTFVYNSRVSAMVKLQKEVSSVLAVNDNGVRGDTDTTPLMRILLHVIRKSQVTVSLDRVYAVMGLLDDRMRESIRVDYSDDLLDTYWVKWLEFFKVMLYFAPSIAEELFALSGSLERHPNLPSWCPNLADGTERRKICDILITAAGMPNGKLWEVPEDVRVVAVMPDVNHVCLLGLKVDDIAHVVDLSWIEQRIRWGRILVDHDSAMDSQAAQEILSTVWRCLELIREIARIPVSEGDAVLARCLVANAYDDQLVGHEQLAQEYMDFVRWLYHHTWGAVGGALKPSTKMGALRFANRFQRMAKKRAFFVTTAGRSGLCSNRAQNGDHVCVLMNFRYPYLLRSHGQDEPFELIGETYIDGMMNGEAFHRRDMTQGYPEELIIG